MKILITGHGRMGKLIESTATAQGHTVAAIISRANAAELLTLGKVADVIIDFSVPALIAEYSSCTVTSSAFGGRHSRSRSSAVYGFVKTICFVFILYPFRRNVR